MSEEERELIRALVGQRQRQWHEDPYFHAAIENLARMLPHMVAGLALESQRQRKDHGEEAAWQMNQPWNPGLAALFEESNAIKEERGGP